MCISRASISRFAPSQVTNTSKLVHTFEFVPPPGSFLTVSPLVTTLAPGSVQRVQFDFTPMLSEPEPAVPPPAEVRACPPLLLIPTWCLSLLERLGGRREGVFQCRCLPHCAGGGWGGGGGGTASKRQGGQGRGQGSASFTA